MINIKMKNGVYKRTTTFTPSKNQNNRLIYKINTYYKGKLSGEYNTKFCFYNQLAEAIEQQNAIGYTAVVIPEPKYMCENADNFDKV